MFIAIGLGALALILLIVIIIIATSSSGNSDNSRKEVLGEINCIYDIETTSKSSLILAENFKKENNFDIEIDGEIIKYSKEFQFNTPGEHKINFLLYEDINIDYMFENIFTLISVKFSSEKNCKIISMKSTFNNAAYLRKFFLFNICKNANNKI